MPSGGLRFGSTPSSGGGTRLGTSGGTRFGQGPSVEEPKKRKKLGPIPLIEFGDVGSLFAGPFSYLLGDVGIAGERGRVAGNVFGALGSSPYMTVRHPKSTARGAKSVVTGLWEAPYGAYKLHQQGMSAREIGALFASGMIEDYKRRYGKDWKQAAAEDPLSNLFDALTVLGAGARVAALSGASSRLAAAGLKGSARDIWKESSRPGLISGGKFDEEGNFTYGEPFSRKILYQPDDPELPPILGTQPYSRSPLRRGFQQAADTISQGKLPATGISAVDDLAKQLFSRRLQNAPLFGSRSRVTRAGASQLRRAIDRALGGLTNSAALNALSDAERSRLFWGTQLGDHSPETLKRLRTALKDEYDGQIPDGDAEFAEWLRAAKSQGFGEKLLERLDQAILVAEKTPIPEGRYLRAVEFMQEATNLSESVIKDANGFTSLLNDIRRAEDRIEGLGSDHPETAAEMRRLEKLEAELSTKESDLNQMFGGRRGRVRDWLNGRAVADNEIREGRISEWRQGLGDEQAGMLTQIFDRVANTMYRDDPNRFWDERVGAATGESVEEFLARSADALFQPGRRTIFESGIEGADADIYYSPLQKWANEQMPTRMPKEDFENLILKNISKEEISNSSLDLYLEAMDDGDFVYKEQLLDFLANPMNQYGLEEIVLVRGVKDFDTRWDKGDDGEPLDDPALLSREAKDGEYREIILRLPGEGRNATYMGKGHYHWGQENVVAHVRYHVFEEDGKRKLLIEELQSDWASEHRDARRAGLNWEQPSDDAIRQIDLLQQKQERISKEVWEMRDEKKELLDENLRGYAPGEQGEKRARYVRSRLDEITDDETDLFEQYYDLNDEIEKLGGSGTPPAPLGEKYYRALIRRIAREAAEEDVDEIVMPDPLTQAIRNDELGNYRISDGGPELTRAEFGADDHGTWTRLYGKEFLKVLENEYKLVPTDSDSAFVGRLSNQYGDRSEVGPMSGRVYAFTSEAKEKAGRASPLYQRQPDWKGLPKGATEYLEGGKTRIHAFKSADVSTWIHELAHVAFHDLPDGDKDLLSRALAGGRPFKDWLETDHESFARAFERYFRDGVAPIPELRSPFRKIAEWIGVIWEREKQTVPDLDADVKRVFDSMLASHQPDVFIPHRAGAPNLTGARTSRGIPRAQRDIGTEVASRAPLFRRNNLSLMRSGLLNDDPRTLVEHVNRVIMLARANQLREAVLDMARPLKPGDPWDPDTQYIVKKAGRGIDRPKFDALEASDDPQGIQKTISDFVDDNITDDMNKYEEWQGEGQVYVVDKGVVDQLFKHATGKTPGATTKPSTTATKVLDATLDSIRGLLLYANPGFYMANIVGNSLMLGAMNPAGYRDIAWSMRQAVKAAHHEDAGDPQWHRIATEMGRGPTAGGLSAQPTILGRKENGVLAAIRDRPKGTTGAVAEGVSHTLGSWGRRSGRIIDDSWRVAAWKQAARARGYKTADEIDELLDAASSSTRHLAKADSKVKRDLNAIRDEAEQLMLDFDSMTPFERTYLTRMIFLYPFLKASAKYPLMYGAERPIATGIAGQAGVQGQLFANQALGERPELPAWLDMAARGPGGMWNVGSVAPFAASLGLLESAMGVGQEPEIGIATPWEYANPFYQLLLELGTGRNKFGQEKPAQEIIRQDFPAPTWLRYWWKKPSKIYAERDYWNTLLRSLRGPFEVSAEEAQKQAEENR